MRGEINNRVPGIIEGDTYLEGLNEPIRLELEGNGIPDMAGRHLAFSNLAKAWRPCNNFNAGQVEK